MGDPLEASALVVGHDAEVQHRLQRCVAALQRMVDGGWFVDHEDTIGMEVELDLVDPLGRPRLVNDAVLARLGRADMQHEFGQFSVELNLAPRRLQCRVLRDSESELAGVLDQCSARIEGLDARLVAVGMLPTLSAEQLTVERISGNPRYALLCRRMRAAHHGPFLVHIIDGCEPVEFSTDSIAPTATATSLQLHLRVPPDRFVAARARRDYHHKQALALVRENQVLHVEDLNIVGMVKNRRLARAINDAGWGQFVRIIGEKADRYGRTLHTVSRWLASSTTCSACGNRLDELPLRVRQWSCPTCSVTHDRDHNAAKVISPPGGRRD
jgi:IS605 OrfB family transposase